MDPSNNVPLRQVSLLPAILATPLCSKYAAHLSIKPTFSKTERWVKEGQQVWSPKRSNQDFYHLNNMFPNFTSCIICDLFTGRGAVKSVLFVKFLAYARGSIPNRIYGQIMSQFCQWAVRRSRESPIFHFSLFMGDCNILQDHQDILVSFLC